MVFLEKKWKIKKWGDANKDVVIGIFSEKK